MTRAIDVLAYITDQYKSRKRRTLGDVQGQKLLYYSQAWALAWDGVPLFDDEIQAWKMGPVVPKVWKSPETGSADALTPDERTTVDAVIGYYGDESGSALSEKAHQESPWREARGNLPLAASSQAPISRASMRREHTHQSRLGTGPKRPRPHVVVARSEDVRALMDQVEKRWSHTLELLAE